MWQFIIPSPIGKIGMTLQNEKLINLSFVSSSCKLKIPKNGNEQHIVNELSEYFKNPAHCFSINLLYQGTSFQQKVWQALQHIPSGQTLTYGELAKELRTHPRAIGQACRTNPITIIIPCHRIVAANGLGGYSGKREGAVWERKKWLLQHEGFVKIFS